MGAHYLSGPVGPRVQYTQYTVIDCKHTRNLGAVAIIHDQSRLQDKLFTMDR